MLHQNCVFIRQTAHTMMPSYMIGRMTSFVFYDHHPKDERTMDITICSDIGEVIEYYQRELISSVLIENVREILEIRIIRNSKCELFYLVVARDELIILSSKGQLKIHRRVYNVESYTIEDSQCKGHACLSIIRKDDAMRLEFDDNFDNLAEKTWEINVASSEESLPIVTQLMKKLTEAKYVTLHNKEKYKELLNLRQATTFALYEKIIFHADDSQFELGLKQASNFLRVEAESPIVKLCNKKLVVIINLVNNNNKPMKNVYALLHSTVKESIDYTTKVYESLSGTQWKEKDCTIHKGSTVVATIGLKELQYDVTSEIKFEIVVSYTINERTHLLPLESVSVSALNIMDENFDIFHCPIVDTKYLLLCIIATSECYDLRLRYIRNPNEKPEEITLSDIFHKYLKMEQYIDNVAINKSPKHILYGVAVIFDCTNTENVMNVQVYTRFPSQVLALIQYMYDMVPYTIIATPSDYMITAINNNMSSYNENMQLNHKYCALSILNQIQLIQDYTEECKHKMMENGAESRAIDEEKVDLLVLGMPRYIEFRSKLLEENVDAIKKLYIKEDNRAIHDDDCMIVD